MSELRELIIEAIRTIKDPELPINIHDLGLIRDITITDGNVQILMTLTTPNCPVADMMPQQVFEIVAMVEDVKSVKVDLCWEPAWSLEDLTPKGRAVLELMDIDISYMIQKHNDSSTGITVNKKSAE